MKREIRKRVIILAVCIVVTLVTGIKLVSGMLIQRNAYKLYDEIQQETDKTKEVNSADSPVESTASAEGGEKTIGNGRTIPDFADLRKRNEDIYAWIYIPDTNIDYPVVQHGTDNSYYLTHNLDGTMGYPGCIYSEKENSREFDDFQTVLYGHNMKNGSMFHDLTLFADANFIAQHPYIYIYTEGTAYVYQIFAAYEYSDEHLLTAFQYDTQEGREKYIAMLAEHNVYYGNLEILEDSRILTLSTCIKEKDDRRMLVQGVLIKREEVE